MSPEVLEKTFTYHAPNKEQQVKYKIIRDQAKELAIQFNSLCPESRELSLAITYLQISVAMANASIAIHTS